MLFRRCALILAIPLTLHLGACAGDDSSASSESTAAASTQGMSSTSGQSSATATSSTSSTTTDATTSETDATDATTTGGATFQELEAACQAQCAKALECLSPSPYPDADSCAWSCTRGLEDESAACLGTRRDLGDCLAALDCEALKEAFKGGSLGECQAASDGIGELCEPACTLSVTEVAPGACYIGEQCPDNTSYGYECADGTCTCVVDGEVGESCPADGICDATWESQAAAANGCCGFSL